MRGQWGPAKTSSKPLLLAAIHLAKGLLLAVLRLAEGLLLVGLHELLGGSDLRGGGHGGRVLQQDVGMSAASCGAHFFLH